MHSLLATLALAAGFGGALALARARRPLRAWRRASGIRPAGSPAAMWRRLYGAPETDPELEALRREARLWHGCAAACLAVALALSIAAALT